MKIEREYCRYKKEKPQNGTHKQRNPENSNIVTNSFGTLIIAERSIGHVGQHIAATGTTRLLFGSILEHPVRLSVVVNIIPPPQTDQHSTSHIFDHPKIDRYQEDKSHKTPQKLLSKGASKQINDN